MNVTTHMSRLLADFTLKHDPDERRGHENLVYQYAVTINFVSIVVLTLIFGWLTGRLSDTLIAGAAFTVLRVSSGGFHFKSLDLCAIVTAVIYAAIPFIPISLSYVPILNVASVVLVAFLAPTNLRNTAWTDSARAKLTFKIVAIAIVSVNFAIESPIIAGAFLAQALTLIPRREVKPL
ncbi:accessory gene regulator B family protein [Paenibacillus sp. SI8]|uniref:accessory gene regulator B family protein n=1 Tax=unclassified Paenibacillus TaxID=185978 RepID=UPI0034665560